MREIIIGKNEENQRFDKWLFKYLNQAQNGFIRKMLRKKNITLNGKKSDGTQVLKQGDCVRLFLAEETIEKFRIEKKQKKTCHVKPDVVYEDAHIILANKPVGMLSQKAKPGDISINDVLTSYYYETQPESEESFVPGICNRLDRNTSGLVIFGKSLYGLQQMATMLKERTLNKYYLTIVKGKMTEGANINGYLAKNPEQNKVRIFQTPEECKRYAECEKEDYVPIQTAYEPMIANEYVTLLKVKLITGKTHQIRAHLSSIGHPIIGDYKYGNKRTNDYFKKEFGLEAQLLHAYELEFPDNCDNEAWNSLNVHARLPVLFLNICKKMFPNERLEMISDSETHK